MRLAFLIGVALIGAVTTMNVFTTMHEAPDLAWWEPATWEYTSALAAIVALVVPWRAVLLAPPGATRWPRLLVVHGLASLLFSAVHVGLFLVLRHGVYAALGREYLFDLTAAELFYEYRKDLLGYTAGVAIFWLASRRRAPPDPSPPAAETASSVAPVTYDIRDGGRVLRVRPGEIVAATSAGNYVEFILVDGRRPLARATLAGVEAELAAQGLVRTHRSWLVNVAHVRELSPEGSGDYALALDGGHGAPLSRRYPDALARLRAQAGPEAAMVGR